MLFSFEIQQFRSDLLAWFTRFQRDLPWRRTQDPYAIWLSETMLQQTRVAAVKPYYERFLVRFPDLRTLAEAPEANVLAAWAGLGYYYRARNMQKAAQLMCRAGEVPASYEQLRMLPGVGEYTAAAVASIAFGLPHAVLDGNVFRVLSRLFADETDIASSKGRKHFTQIAAVVLDRDSPGAFNQAMMELGATVCLSRNPQCLLCPVSSFCQAHRSGQTDGFPVNSAKQKSVREHRTLFWVQDGEFLLAWRRPPESRLMPGFWELPERTQLPHITTGQSLSSFRHSITFHNYLFDVLEGAVPKSLGCCEWLSFQQFEKMPLSTVFKKAALAVAKYRMRHSTISKAAIGRVN